MRESEIFASGVLRERVALVTGGGTGLGLATAVELARCGASVVVCGRREEVLREAASRIAEVGGTADADADGLWVAGDVREVSEAERLVETVLERYGRLDVLVNNAGGQFFSPAELIAAKGWRAVWRLNVEGALNMAEAAYRLAFSGGEGAAAGAGAGSGLGSGARGARAVGEAGAASVGASGAQVVRDAGVAGTIVNVTLSPHNGMPGMVHSGAARAAVEALTRELAARWAEDGIVVTAVAAGHFDTEVLAKYPAGVREGASRTVPLQRLGRAEEHAWLVALLSSPLGRLFNGSTVTLDGARDNWFGPWPPPGLAGEGGQVPVEERR
jgi:citronellol/citronellal dehydrogenase